MKCPTCKGRGRWYPIQPSNRWGGCPTTIHHTCERCRGSGEVRVFTRAEAEAAGVRYNAVGSSISSARYTDQGLRWQPGDGAAFDEDGATGGYDSDGNYSGHGD